MRIENYITSSLFGLAHFAAAGPTYDPFIPPSYPLAVRSPYLSAWLPGKMAASLPSSLPQFWAGQDLNLGVMARVGSKVYTLMSIPAPPTGAIAARLLSAQYTTTHTRFILSADSNTFTLDFFSPVSPKNYLRQSLPFSYLTISVHGASSPVQIYADFDESWTGQNSSTVSTLISAAGTLAYQLSVKGAVTYSQKSEMALWGQAVFASTPIAKATTQTGPLTKVRDAFARKGSLNNENGAYTSGDIVAIAQTISGDVPAQFAIGHVREAAINYNGATRTGYYRSQYPDLMSSLNYFFSDYTEANAESHALDNVISSQASKTAGSNYSDILSLSTRQSYGALDLTIDSMSLDTGDILIFVKEISSDGNVNTLDVLYPTFPIWYVMSPDYIRYTLEPVMRYLETGAWKLAYAIHDLGANYPNATGYPISSMDESQPVEESGNIILLAYAYSHAVGNTDWARKYLNHFQKFADYLVKEGLKISKQLSTDDGAGALANQTNLAIKAAVSLNAFGKMFDMAYYSTVGLDYSHRLYQEGLGTDDNKTHFTLQYGKDGTFTTAFNLYPDILFNLSTFPTAAYQMQSTYYPTVRLQAGVPLDNRVDWAKTDWAHFAAAYSTIPGTRDMFVNDVWAFVSDSQSNNQAPFSDRWFVSKSQGDVPGAYNCYKARPVVGGHFALLALAGAGTVTT